MNEKIPAVPVEPVKPPHPGESASSSLVMGGRKSLDQLKEEYTKRLDVIVYKELTVDNIHTFADTALEEIVDLMNDLLKEYKENPVFKGNNLLNQAQQEDDATTKLGLLNVSEILEEIVKVRDSVKNLEQYLNTQIESISTVITPPNVDGSGITPGDYGNKFEQKELFPRLLTLIYILQHDFGINPEEVSIVEGIVPTNSIRQNPYYRVTIKDLNRIVYICNEKGNTSYVFDTEILKDHGINIETIDVDSKDEKNVLIDKYPGIGKRIVHKKNWRRNISVLLDSLTVEIEDIDSQTKNYKKSEFVNVEDVQDGYITNNLLSKELGVSPNTTERVADEYRATNPEWFKMYKAVNGRIFEHYSPELIELIKVELNSRKEAPQGWMTNKELSKELGVGSAIIEREINKYRETNPEWFKIYKDKAKRPSEHFSPELVEKIRLELNSFESVPFGWITNTALANNLGVAFLTTKKTADKYRETNPEWFKMYKAVNGRIFEHYSPELIEKIKSELNSFEFSPPGWMTNTMLTKELSVDDSTTKKTADEYRETNHEWFKMYKATNARIFEYYSPELVAEIKRRLGK